MTIEKYRLKKSKKKTRQILLSKTEPLHLVLKANRRLLKEQSFRSPRSFRIIQILIRRYAQRFHVRIDQMTIQGDHLRLLVRCSHRFFYHAFFRVLAGQIAQRLQQERLLHVVTDTPNTTKAKPKLWMHRPFSRVVRGFRAYGIVRDYIQLNEKEARGIIRYRSQRLVGLSSGKWALLWGT